MKDLIFVSSVATLTLGYFFLKAWGEYARREMVRLSAFRHWTSVFFASANKVLDADAAPADAVRNIDFLRRKLGEKGAAKEMALALMQAEGNQGGSTKFNDAFGRCPRDLQDAIENALISGMMAISYTDRTCGLVARAFLAGVQADSRESPAPIYRSVASFAANKAKKKWSFFSSSDHALPEAA